MHIDSGAIVLRALHRILDVKIRVLGTKATATIDVADGYAASEIKQRLYGSSAPGTSRNSIPLPLTASSRITSTPPLSRGSPSGDPSITPIDAAPEAIDLVSDNSDMDVSSDGDPIATDQQELSPPEGRCAAEVPASPALSYVTIEDPDDIKPIIDAPPDNPKNDGKPRHDPLAFLYMDPHGPSSDQESEDEDTPQTTTHVAPPLPQPTPEEVLANSIFYGPIAALPEDVLAQAEKYATASRVAQTSTSTRLNNPVFGGNTSNRRIARPQARVAEDLRNHSTARNRNSETNQARNNHQTPAESTICVPKADFAKGRRVLLPKNKALPMAAVYMRGDAQFIDQRRRYVCINRRVSHKFNIRTCSVRLSQLSLPIEKDDEAGLRHVVDAHLLRDDLVVLGYSHGRTQVTCLPLDEV